MMIINVCAYNAGDYIEECINSIKQQEDGDFKVLITDDHGSDNTYEFALRLTEGDDRFIVTRNHKNMGAVYNKTVKIKEVMEPEDEDIIIGLDGDDYFSNSKVTEIIRNIYKDENIWCTYGSYSNAEELGINWEGPVDWSIPLRTQWHYSHPRTHKWFLLKNINDSDLKYGDGHWFTVPEDWVIMCPSVEMAGPKHIKWVQDKLVYYRITPLNDHYVNKYKGDEVRFILANLRRPYPQVTKEILIESDCDWK